MNHDQNDEQLQQCLNDSFDMDDLIRLTQQYLTKEESEFLFESGVDDFIHQEDMWLNYKKKNE